MAGRQIVDLVKQDIRPSHVMTREAFENGIRTLHALGGSTNAVIHLTAIAGRLGIDLPGTLFDELSRTTPFILNLKPSGQYLMEDFYYAGGVGALLKEISPLIHGDTVTVTGQTLAENISTAINYNPDIIRSMDDPMDPEGGLAVLTGTLAPTGALIKPTAASESLLTHEGRAIVFEDHDDLFARIDDPDLDVTPDDVLVMRSGGPIGAPGMPEWGFLPLPKKILASGVRDMVRLSDARMSGTAFGTVVVHVTPSPPRAAHSPPSETATASTSTYRTAASTSSSKTGKSGAACTNRLPNPPYTNAATHPCTPATSSRQTPAATSTSCSPKLPIRIRRLRPIKADQLLC